MGHSLNRTGFRINQNLIIDDNTFNPGYILVSDSKGNASWKNPSEYIDQTEPLDHFIGELYGGGVVVAVWREQREVVYEKVLIASVRDYGEQLTTGATTNFTWTWGSGAFIGPSSSYNSYGASNSLANVAEELSQGNPSPPAATKCLSYINEDLYGLGVYGDWYLPSTFELNCLANNAGIVNRVISQYAADKSIRLYDQGVSGSILSASMSLFCGAVSGPRPTGMKYWTSTETGSSKAYCLQMDDLKIIPDSKISALNVRPFRLDTKRWNGLTWVQDRNKTGKILIVDNGSSYFDRIEPVITSVEVGLGNTTDTITSYSLLPDDLSIYDHIWDVDVLTNQLTVLNNTKYTNYLKQGGALFILGENKSFPTRDNDLATFITGLGGGTVTFDTTFPRFSMTMCDVDSEFLLANNISTVGFNWVGRFSNIGTGSPITRLKNAIPASQGSPIPLVTTNGTLYDVNTTEYPVGTTGNAVVWKTGSLSAAPKGAIVVVLDINFIISDPPQQVNGSDFMANISQILNKS